SYPASHVLLAPSDARRGDAVSAGTGGSPGPDDDPAVFAPESGRFDRYRQVAGAQGSRLGAWSNTGAGRRPRSQVEVVERSSWLGGRGPTPDPAGRSPLSSGWTTSQSRAWPERGTEGKAESKGANP